MQGITSGRHTIAICCEQAAGVVSDGIPGIYLQFVDHPAGRTVTVNFPRYEQLADNGLIIPAHHGFQELGATGYVMFPPVMAELHQRMVIKCDRTTGQREFLVGDAGG